MNAIALVRVRFKRPRWPRWSTYTKVNLASALLNFFIAFCQLAVWNDPSSWIGRICAGVNVCIGAYSWRWFQIWRERDRNGPDGTT